MGKNFDPMLILVIMVGISLGLGIGWLKLKQMEACDKGSTSACIMLLNSRR